MSKGKRMGNEEKKVCNEATRIEKPMEQYSPTYRHRYGLVVAVEVVIFDLKLLLENHKCNDNKCQQRFYCFPACAICNKGYY